MAFTATDLSAIEKAIAMGELTVELDGRRITYRSIPELLAARDVIRNELQSSGASPKRTTRSFAAHRRE